MTAPRVIQEKFDAAGNLVEITWDDTDCTSMGMLIALRAASRRMNGRSLFTVTKVVNSLSRTVSCPIYDGQSLRVILETGAASGTLIYNGDKIHISRMEAIILGTLLDYQGQVFTAAQLIEIIYPDPNKQPSSALTSLYARISELRRRFPGLIDAKKYVIRGQ